MLTECPHCLSVLKVSAELIYAGDPRVRCGECLRVFSARDHLTQAEADMDSTKIYQPPKQLAVATEEPGFSLKPEVAQGLQALVDKPRKKKLAASNTARQTPDRNRRAAIPSRTLDQAVARATKPTSSTAPATPLGPTPEQPATAKKAPARPDRHISVLERSRSAPIRHRSTLTFIALAALTLLAINAVRSVMVDESQRSRFSAAWCNVINCGTAISQDYSQLQIVRRKIYGHPNIDGVLVISLAMVNRLSGEMHYPTLQVRMTNRGGEVIARGLFKPRDYVPRFETGMTITPERVVDVVLQVEDPGDAAQSFDLEFL